MTHVIEKILRVYDDKENVFLEVRQNPDYPESGIVICTTNPESEQWYGKIDLPLNSKEQAQVLAKAILEMAEMIE